MNWKPTTTFPLHPIILALIIKKSPEIVHQKSRKNPTYVQKCKKRPLMSIFECFLQGVVYLKIIIYGLYMVFINALRKMLSLKKSK